MTFMRGNDNPSNAEIKSTTKFKSTTKIKMSLCFVTSLLLIFSAGCSTSPKPGSTTPPTVLSEGPPSAAAGSCQNTVVTITFSKAMNASTIDTTTFTLTAPGPTPVLGVVTYAAASDTATFTPSGPLVLNTAYTATITTGATDTFGNAMAANFVWSFTTGTAACQAGAPTVISSAPVNGSTGVCPNAVVIAGFGGPMDASTIDATTFTLTGPTAAAATGTVAYDATNRFATFTPTSSLALNSLYTATITTGAMDTSGNAVAADFVWSFTTGSTACQTAAPTVVASVPLNGAGGVCPSTIVTGVLSSAMNAATIDGTTFTLTAPGPTSVAGVVSYAANSDTAIFTPSASLALNTLYTATITSGATDTFGNALAADFVWTFTTAAASCQAVAPTVISSAPSNGSMGVCPNTVAIAGFSAAMNPSTISNTTLTLTGPAAAAVTGTVGYDPADRFATFTPAANLALNTLYTANVSTGAQDLLGNALATDFQWSFTTSTLACQSSSVPMGSAANFVVLAGSTVTNTGPTIITGGNLGLSPGSAVTGFPPGTLTPPAVMDVTDPTAATAELDLTTAYLYTAGLPGGAVLPGDLSGLTLTPGLYTNSSTVMLSAGNLTLDAQGNANAVFIFQIGSTLTTIGSTQIVLAGGAQAQNVYWQVSSSATLGTNSIFEGTILSLESITLDTGATLTGRALARNGAVALDANMITAP